LESAISAITIEIAARGGVAIDQIDLFLAFADSLAAAFTRRVSGRQRRASPAAKHQADP
jgi:hypothetical protein